MAAAVLPPTRALRVGVLSPDSGWRTLLAKRLAPVEDLRVVRHGSSLDEVDVEAVLTHETDVLILDLGPGEAAPEGWQEAWQALPYAARPALVVAASGLTPALYRTLISYGARETVLREAPLSDLTEAVYRQANRAGAAPHQDSHRPIVASDPHGSLVVTVFSLRGGSGKTSVSIELAAALHRRLGAPVALLDMALGLGQVGVALRLRPARPLGDLLTDGASLDGETLRTFLSSHTAGLEVLCAPDTPEVAEYVRQSHVTSMVRASRSAFRATVLDTSSALGEADFAAAQEADSVLLVLGPDLPSAGAARMALNLFDRFDISQAKVGLVLNRWRGFAPRPRDVEAALGIPVWSVIPEDPTCLTAMNRGLIAHAVAKRSAAVLAAEQLVTRLVGEARRDLAPGRRPRHAGRLGS